MSYVPYSSLQKRYFLCEISIVITTFHNVLTLLILSKKGKYNINKIKFRIDEKERITKN